MKRGRSWTTRCPAELLRRMQEAVDARDESARDIYDRLNLARFTRLATFQHWVPRRRRDRASRAGHREHGTGSGEQVGAIAAGVEPAAARRELAELVDLERRRKRWSASDLAAAAGVSCSVLSRLKRDGRVGVVTVLKLLAAVGADPGVVRRAAWYWLTSSPALPAAEREFARRSLVCEESR